MFKPSASISSISFSGGDTFNFTEKEKIIIVGANNSGKSQTLREILSLSKTNKKVRSVVLESITVNKIGTEKELETFLEKEASYINGQYRYNNWNLQSNHIQFWKLENLVNEISTGFIKNITANERLSICEQQLSISPSDPKAKPQHVLYDNDNLMAHISNLFKKAFGQELMFNFRGGSKIPIHVGDTPKIQKKYDRVSDQYVEAIIKNPLLDQQGDGMKSYAGILFEAIVSNLDIVLIDEPEAFLHPPQMRRLGETLSSEVKGQLFVATHSSDILRGFLEGTKGNIRILRIKRDKERNIVTEASSQTIKELWEKPDLRYSNALEGLFHEQVIICEDDSDCRLMNSVADYISLQDKESWPDTAYVPTGGKHGIPKVAKILRLIGVPTKAVFDIDFLSERNLVAETVAAFGGDWQQCEAIWLRIDAAVRNGKKPKTNQEIKNDIVSIIEKSDANSLPKGDITEALKQGSPWADIKRYGTAAIPGGHAQKEFNKLQNYLEEIGIYVIPTGEAENFCKEIGLHGPKFVTKLLATIPLSDPRLEQLRSFVKKVHI